MSKDLFERPLVRPKEDPGPTALACYGLLVRHGPNRPEQMLLRCVAGRPVSTETTAFLAWCSERLAAEGMQALLLIGENAAWHTSQAVHTWLRQHTSARQADGAESAPSGVFSAE